MIPAVQSESLKSGYLRRKISGITSIPLVVMAVIFLVAYASKVQRDRLQSERGILDDYSGRLKQQEYLIAMEIFQQGNEALLARTRMILAPEESANRPLICMRWDIDPAFGMEASGKVFCNRGTPKWQTLSRASLTIQQSGRDFGSVSVGVKLDYSLVDYFPTDLMLATLIALVGIVGLNFLLVSRIQGRIVNPLLEQLQETARFASMARTAQILAHDIRAPFSSIAAFLSIIKKKMREESIAPLTDRLIAEVEQKRRNVERMISDILEASQGDSTARERWEKVEVKTALIEALEQVFQADLHSEIDITCELEDITVLGRAAAIQRVFENILSNAVRAMERRGRISLKSRLDPRKAEVEVLIHNTGSYIPPEKRETIFDLFYSSGVHDGSGLGLAISRKIIEQHRGTIRCSSSIDEGTSFIITIPGGDRCAPGQRVPPSSSRDIRERWITGEFIQKRSAATSRPVDDE